MEDACPVVRRGQYYKHKDGEIYIVAYAGEDKYSLISIAYGSRWSEPCDIEEVFCHRRKDFTLIESGSKIEIEVEY